MKKTCGNIPFLGTTGVGKTELAKAWLNIYLMTKMP
jgi:ATP-dependent Clp protease ATP-binding subunit ClpA